MAVGRQLKGALPPPTVMECGLKHSCLFLLTGIQGLVKICGMKQDPEKKSKESRQGIKNQGNGKWIGSYITTFYSNNNSCNSRSFSPTHTHTALVFMVNCFLTFPLTRMDLSGATLGSVSCQRILQHEDRRSLGSIHRPSNF